MNDVTLTVSLAALGVFLLKEVYGFFKDKEKEHTKALQENTLALTKLTVKMEMLEEKVELIPELKRDVDALHGKIRDLQR